MQVSTKLFNDQQVRQFGKLTADIQQKQEKIASGKAILKASDDPVAAVAVPRAAALPAKVERDPNPSPVAHMVPPLACSVYLCDHRQVPSSALRCSVVPACHHCSPGTWVSVRQVGNLTVVNGLR